MDESYAYAEARRLKRSGRYRTLTDFLAAVARWVTTTSVAERLRLQEIVMEVWAEN